jgi:hypothetical protein
MKFILWNPGIYTTKLAMVNFPAGDWIFILPISQIYPANKRRGRRAHLT